MFFQLESSLLSLSCSSDLCNYVDGADLDVINSANGMSKCNSVKNILSDFVHIFRFESSRILFTRCCIPSDIAALAVVP